MKKYRQLSVGYSLRKLGCEGRGREREREGEKESERERLKLRPTDLCTRENEKTCSLKAV